MAPKQKPAVNVDPIIAGLNVKKVDGVNKVSFYKGDQEFQIMNPKVYFNEHTNTYYFVGEPRYQDYNQQTQQLLQMLSGNRPPAHAHPEGCECEEHKHGEGEEAYTDEDINTVMGQGNVDEAKAKALLEQHKDVVSAVLACQNEKKNE